MLAIVGYLIGAGVAISVVLRLAGLRYTVTPDPSFDPATVASRLVPVLGGLAGFAVTGVVLIVTQSGNASVASHGGLTTVLALFVIGYLGYFSTSLLFANVSDRGERTPFDLGAAQYVGAAIGLYFSTFIGWFALRPLFSTFGLTAAADIMSWLLLGSVVAGYGLLASFLYRTGYATARMTALLPVPAIAVTAAYVVLVWALVPDHHAPDAVLSLVLFAFLPGAAWYLAITTLPIIASRGRAAQVLAERWHLVVIAYSEAVLVLSGFQLVSVLGIA